MSITARRGSCAADARASTASAIAGLTPAGPRWSAWNSHLRGLARLPPEDSVFEWLADRERKRRWRLLRRRGDPAGAAAVTGIHQPAATTAHGQQFWWSIRARSGTLPPDDPGTPAARAQAASISNKYEAVHVLPRLICLALACCRVVRRPCAPGWPAKYRGRLGRRKSAMAGIRRPSCTSLARC